MIFSWLSAHVAAGGLFALLFVEPRDFGRGFHRFTGVCALLLYASALGGGALRNPPGWIAAAAALGFVAVAQWGPVSWIRSSLPGAALAGLAGILLLPSTGPRTPLVESPSFASPANSLAAAVLLGSVAVAMLLGHWYLVIPGLDIRHLMRLTRLFAASVAIRAIVAVAGIAASSPAPASFETSVWRLVGLRHGFFFWQRVGIGLVAPAVLAILVERTVRIRSTQSATGLLYVAVVFVLIGELVSRFLAVAAGIPQ
jgi:hypothetical protein